MLRYTFLYKTRFTVLCFLPTVLLFVMSSCKKDYYVPAASMQVVNASIGINKAFVTTPYTGYFSQLSGVNYGSSSIFTLPAGSDAVSVFNSTDTTAKASLYSNSLAVGGGEIYSVFLAGQSANDVVVNKDNIPYHADSSLGIRFVNLSTTSSPVNVILQQGLTTEFTGVAYKSVTDFKSYGAKASDPASYRFMITDQGGTTLASSSSISKNTVRFKNVTLALIGSKDSSGAKALKVITINNYQ